MSEERARVGNAKLKLVGFEGIPEIESRVRLLFRTLRGDIEVMVEADRTDPFVQGLDIIDGSVSVLVERND